MPSTAEEWTDHGLDLFAEGRYQESIAAYEAALQLDPTLLDALHGLAMAHAEKGDLPAAVAAAERITAAAPDDPLGYTSLSMFLQRSGKIPEAEAAAAKARVLEWKRDLSED